MLRTEVTDTCTLSLRDSPTMRVPGISPEPAAGIRVAYLRAGQLPPCEVDRPASVTELLEKTVRSLETGQR
jgi:hypothetical protein